MDHEQGDDRLGVAEPVRKGDAASATRSDGDRAADRTRECELPGCEVVFRVAGKKKYCTKEHANEAARRRAVLESLAVDVPLEELRALRDQVIEEVGPDVIRLSERLGTLLDRFAALESGAVARIAAAEQTAADAAARADRAEQAQADADRRAQAAVDTAERERAARAAADLARQAAEDRAGVSDEDRVRAETARDVALLAATRADARAELSAQATLAATDRAAEERTRAEALLADLDRERADRTAETTRLRDEARATQNRHDQAMRELREQADARVEDLRARHAAEVEQIRTGAAAEVAAARTEAHQATARYTEAVRDVERERARGQAARNRLLRQLRRTLGSLLDTPDDHTTEETAALHAQRLHDGVTAALRGLDDLADDDTDNGEQQ
jgi:hypothetical protein